MLNYEEELKKFQKSLEIEDAEEAIFKTDMTDMADIIEKINNSSKGAAKQ